MHLGPTWRLSARVMVFWALVPGVVVGAGTGLSGDYFNNADFTSLVTNRVDPGVDFDWGSGVPIGGVASDTFSVRWYGQVEPEFSEEYAFYVTADDGARLWVDDHAVAVRTFGSPQQPTFKARVRLEAGRRANIRLEFIENTGAAKVRLEWSCPSRAREVIPAARLYPGLVDRAGGSILKEHWLGIGGTALSNLTGQSDYPQRPDGRELLTSFECLATNWAEDYGTRVTGFIVPPASGEYTFAVAGDDLVQFRLSTDATTNNLQAIASVQGPTGFREWGATSNQISAPRAMERGARYCVELLHRDVSGADHWSVGWRGPGETNFTVVPGSALLQAGLERATPAQTNLLNTLAQGRPRLFASPERFEWLKQEVAVNPSGKPAVWYTSLTNSARVLATNAPVLYVPDNRGTILNTARTVIDRISKWALTYRTTGDTNYAERVWTEVYHISTNFPNWNPAHFLDVAEMTHAHAIAYDWLYDYWTASRRTLLRTNIVSRGLNEGLADFTGNAGWTQSDANNWNAVCNGGMTLGALAVGTDDEAKAEDVLNRAIASVRTPISRVTTDNGAWYEGPGYWGYTFDYATRMYAGLEGCLGSDFGISSTRGMNEAGHFPIQTSGPFLKSFNFADAGDSSGRVGSVGMWYFARRFNQPLYAWWEHTYASAAPLGALWWHSTGAPPASAGSPVDLYFRGASATTPFKTTEIASMRSAWGDSNATCIAIKGGEMGASHGNLDAGTFVLDALGKRWAYELGGDDYALPGYFSGTPSSGTDRWDYYRCRAEGQNTLVIGTTNGPDMRMGQHAAVVLFQGEPSGDGSKAIMDLTAVHTGVSRVWRGYQLLNGRNEVLIQDEIVAASPRPVWWFMHVRTNGTQIAIDPGGATATLTQGSARLWMRSLAQGTFYLTNSTPLATSPNPAGQNFNTNYLKLAMHLPSVTNSTLAVWMVPLLPGEDPPAEAPAVVPLSAWNAATNTPPQAADAAGTVAEDASVDIDLRSLVSDAETPAGQLRFEVGGAANGTVALLADGRTARFTPAANYSGPASFRYAVADANPDPRVVLAYDFDPPDAADTNSVPDVSNNGRDGTLEMAGAGTFAVTNDSPAALGGQGVRCVELVEVQTNAVARVTCPLDGTDLDLNAEDWTVAGWFKRRDRQNDDFIFYAGGSDGFGGANELQVYGAPGSDAVQLRHYYGNNLFNGPAGIAVPTNTWTHFAATRAGTNLSFYIGGNIVGTVVDTNFGVPQTVVSFGGSGVTNAAYTARWFDGRLDDLAIFRGALASNEVARLAGGMTVRHFGGATNGGTVGITVLPVNDPAVVLGLATSVLWGTSVDVDLRSRVVDVETHDTNLFFSVGPAANGTVVLLPDGHTARFTPSAGYHGPASFQFNVRDERLLLHLGFESPDDTADGKATDATGLGHDATIIKMGTGDLVFTNVSPSALAPESARSARMTTNGVGGACLRATVPTNQCNLSAGDWTISLWFRRANSSTDDYLVYLGNDSGYRDANALQLHCPSGNSRIELAHWNGVLTQDVAIATANGSVTNGGWYHAAIAFDRAATNSGTIRLYLNGASVGSTNVALALDQVRPIAFGGHNHASANPERMLDGFLDDVAVFAADIGPDGVAALAARSVAGAHGPPVSATAEVTVLSPFMVWQQSNFGAAWTNGAIAGEGANPDWDTLLNLIEYGTGGNPMSRAAAGSTTCASDAGRLTIGFTRDPSATDATLTVQAGDDLAGWTDIARSTGGTAFVGLVPGVVITEVAAGPLKRVVVRDAELMAGHRRRFLRLVVGH